MKNKYLIAGISSLAVLAAAAGITTQVSAAAPAASQTAKYSMTARAKHPVLTAAQIAARKTEMTAIQTALTNGDYNAWVTAVKAENPKSPLLTKITAANFSQYATTQANRVKAMAAQKTNLAAIQTALTNGDYNAWVTAVKAENPKSPLLTKITAANFSQYVQAYNLETQAENIFKTLGVNGGEGGFMGGHVKPMGANHGWHLGQAKPTTK